MVNSLLLIVFISKTIINKPEITQFSLGLDQRIKNGLSELKRLFFLLFFAEKRDFIQFSIFDSIEQGF